METKDSSQKSRGTPFKDMTPVGKVRFVLKLAVSIISFGIIFPNIMSE